MVGFVQRSKRYLYAFLPQLLFIWDALVNDSVWRNTFRQRILLAERLRLSLASGKEPLDMSRY